MTNRAERRAQAKRSRRGGQDSYRGADRGRAGVIDERTLQERSRRLAAGESGEWKPRGHSELSDKNPVGNPNYRNPKLVKAPHSLRQWLRIFAWMLIIGSGIAFLVCMWFPSIPLWGTITMAGVFCFGIVLLFFVGGSYKDNPNLDSYGTAV